MNIAADTHLRGFLDLEPELEDFRTAILEGLAEPRKATAAKFFYDEEGSRLFERICELQEYYPTRTECGILRDHAAELRRLLPEGATVIEFGSGSADKIRLFVQALGRPQCYVPIDISRDHLLDNAGAFAAENPAIEVVAVCADFTDPVRLDEVVPKGPRIGFFPGSTIGNLEREEAAEFLRGARRTVGQGGFLVIGVDLKKDPAILEAAYDDAEGVTAAFNLNLLRRINRELDGDFELNAFSHRALWNDAEGRIEMHLVSERDQAVAVAGRRFDFREGETLHTENSHKYGLDEFRTMAEDAGLHARRSLTDANDLFSVHVLEAV
ncbi:L-histidine N(alpha)-methyltransferase [Minwuia thermotolerans]|uniref:L-histidine N(Alpha)-methyltransferase n=1 Tax=Minwuia thermotolerans TaxID=2056226 RepID=A0A2M9FX60_9PROT|nr:L-histidine N(alpha)-methyltransferase [Minwuia thermotolerans]PJK28046.1 L-histidine N(alpha)-methyltransferase [Minwuia thermotolerans]